MKPKYNVLTSKQHFSDAFEFRVFKNPQPTGLSLHAHDFNELVFVVEGKGFHKTLRGKRKIRRGSIFFIPAGGVHGYDTEEGIEIFNLLFSEKVGKEVQKNYLKEVFSDKKSFVQMLKEKLQSPVQLPPVETVSFEGLIKKIVREFDGKRRGYETVTKTYFAELIISLLRHLEKESDMKMSYIENDERIGKVLSHIEKRYAEKVTLKELADKVGLVPSYFSAFFTKETGYTVFEYITEYRIYKASHLLKSTSNPVLEIAYGTGFQSISLFNRIFKRITGFSPRAFRRHLQKI